MLQLITSNLFWCLILTSVCFTMAIAIWKGLVRYFKKRDKFQLILGWMSVVLLFGTVPLVYLTDKLVYWLKSLAGVSEVMVKGRQMWYTFGSTLIPFVSIVLIIWLIGVAAAAVYFWIQKSELNRMLAFREKVRDERVLYWFEQTKAQLGITRKIGIYENALMTTPVTLTWDKQAVVIPKRDYSDRELQVMFSHELLHIRNKDYRKKQIATIACCIHWYNPMAWRFFAEMNKWCETDCDCSAVSFLAARDISAGEYFTVLLDLVHHCNKESIWFLSSESGDKEEWERRFSAVTGNLKVKDMKKLGVGITVVLLMVFITSTVYGAGLQVDKVNAQYALDTVVEYEEEYVPVTYEETVETLTDAQMAAIEVDENAVISTSNNLRALSGVTWTLDPGESLRGAYVYLHQGDTVPMTGFIDPDNVQMKIGLLCTDNTLTSIRATKEFAHTFTISKNGFYAIYAENMGSATATIRIFV